MVLFLCPAVYDWPSRARRAQKYAAPGGVQERENRGVQKVESQTNHLTKDTNGLRMVDFRVPSRTQNAMDQNGGHSQVRDWMQIADVVA